MDRTSIDFTSIGDQMFVPAIMVRDIVQARPLTRDEKAKLSNGAPDILMTPIIGTQYMASRKDVSSNFTYTNGKRIKISGWDTKKGTKYIIYRPCNVMVVVMQVPTNSSVSVHGKIANQKNRKRGDYIVCLTDENGRVIRDSASIVSAALFRKSCYIPRNDIIEKHKGSHNKLFDFSSGMAFAEKKQYDEKDWTGGEVPRSPVPKFIRKEQQETQPAQPRNSSRPNIVPTIRTSNGSTVIQPGQVVNSAPFRVTGQINDAYGHRVGYIISNSSGETRKINKDTAVKLTLEKKIGNVEAVRGPDGSYYLRGNGITLDSLPITYA